MNDEYLGKTWFAWVALTVVVVTLFLFSHTQECTVNVASVLLRLPF